MITLHNNYQVDFACASGAAAFGFHWPWNKPLNWLGVLPGPNEITTIIKTLTAYPRRGNFDIWSPSQMFNLYRNVVQKVEVNKNGIGWTEPNPYEPVTVTVNRIGLTNPGIAHWVEKIFPKLNKKLIWHIISVMAESVEQASFIGRLLSKCKGAIKGIEVNYSCPNTDNRDASVQGAVDIIKAIQEETDHPIGIKLAWQDPHVDIAMALKGKIEWVTLINTIPWNILFPDYPSPFRRYGPEPGGVSGEYIRTYAVEAVKKHVVAGLDIPVMACGGITKSEHVHEFCAAGAAAYQIGTLYKDNPRAIKPLIERYHREAKEIFVQ